jgi:hypothetical protein
VDYTCHRSDNQGNGHINGMTAMQKPETLLPKRLRMVIWSTILATQLFYVALILSGLLPGAATPVGLPYLVPAFAVLACGFGVAAQILWLRSGGRDERVTRSPANKTPLPVYHIAVWALDEGIGVLALGLAVLGYGAGTWGLFCVAGILLTLVHHPV